MSSKSLKIPLEQLRRVCDPTVFSFEDTSKIEPIAAPIGQDRAVKAISFGIEIAASGYHIYALGPGGTGKQTMTMDFLERKSADEPVPADWCYVNNFDSADEPLVIRLNAGEGHIFVADIQQLIEDAQVAIPQTFDSDEYYNERETIENEMKTAGTVLVESLNTKAEERDFKVVHVAQGIAFVPIVDGKPIKPEQLEKLDEEKQAEIEATVEILQDEARLIMRQIRQYERDTRIKLRELDRQVASFAIEPSFEVLRIKYAEKETVTQYLDATLADILDHIELFTADEEKPKNPFAAMKASKEDLLERYAVNLLVDNRDTEGAPVIFEDNPNYHRLMGRIEYEVETGALVTDFTQIKAGALHRANGGYLVLDARAMLTKPFVWEALKLALKNEEIRLAPMAEEMQAITTHSLQPQSIPLDIKVVLLGDPFIYYLLHSLDENFRELFKVKADFATQMDWTEDSVQQYAHFIAMICQMNDLKPFSASGVAKIIEESGRAVSDQNKLLTRFADVVDLIMQASYWAGKNGNGSVQAEDVQHAILEHTYRSNRIEERLQELIDDGTIMVDTDGAVVGQVNGLAVLQMGAYSFGKPSRITAQTYVGGKGMIAIDREAEMAGNIHNKGVLILSGYMGGQYGHDEPLVFSASLSFEQMYEMIDGDSASSTELYALLSSLSGLPIRQDIAVTGSVNQRGQVQAIGGVNQKIEGFYDVCRLRGLTKTQGVMIPKTNVRNLMLREDVIEAVKNGEFHIYAVETIDEGIELLTSVAAGECDEERNFPEDSVHGKVQHRLRELAQKAKDFSKKDEEKSE